MTVLGRAGLPICFFCKRQLNTQGKYVNTTFVIPASRDSTAYIPVAGGTHTVACLGKVWSCAEAAKRLNKSRTSFNPAANDVFKVCFYDGKVPAPAPEPCGPFKRIALQQRAYNRAVYTLLCSGNRAKPTDPQCTETGQCGFVFGSVAGRCD